MAEVEPDGREEGRLRPSRALRVLVLTGVLLLAFLLRAPHAGAGFPYLHHWNEPYSVSTALRMMTTGDLNPHWFQYGTLPIYLNLGVDVLNYFRLMGKPAEADTHLTNLGEITFSSEHKAQWTISHPSFYHWNRLLTVVFGVATVLTVYFLGAAVSGPVVGLIAASWLAVLPLHIMHSARITPDVLVTLLTLNVVLFSVRFATHERLSDLATALAFAGLASATKYNSAAMLVLPVALLAWSVLRRPGRISLWQSALLLLLPVLVFLTAMPYALLDLPNFLRGAGAEVRHYRVDGHGPLTIEPGWQQIRFQSAELLRNAGPLACALALIGLATAWQRRAKFLWMLLAPAVYFFFMIQMRINFHRSFLPLYPYLAILIALGIMQVHRIARDRDSARRPVRWLPVHWLGVALGVVVLMLPTGQSVLAAHAATRQIETRSEAVLKLNELRASGFENAVIATELEIHPLDLNKLELPHQLIPTNQFYPLLRGSPRTVFVIPETLEFSDLYSTKGNARLVAALDRLKDALPEKRIIERIGGEESRSAHHTGDPPFPPPGATRLDFYSVNPVILLVSGGKNPPPPAQPPS